ncbi:hypothetical protein [Virgibacillus ainsalahensis]
MIQLNELKNEFKNLLQFSKHERMLQASALLTAYFELENIKPIIVGGLSVEIYTRNNYTTYDIDLITDGRDKFDVLLTKELDFVKEGRSWYHKELEISIEIPDNFLEGSLEKVFKMELENGRYIFVVGVEDIIIHRLESAVVSHPDNPEWTDDYEWAERMFQIHRSDEEIMDLDYLRQTAKEAEVGSIVEQWLKK